MNFTQYTLGNNHLEIMLCCYPNHPNEKNLIQPKPFKRHCLLIFSILKTWGE